MKFCYVDESYDDSENHVHVMAAIVADAVRLGRTQRDFAKYLELADKHVSKPLTELKSTRIFYGKGVWKSVPKDTRLDIFFNFANWLKERKHTLTFAATDTQKFATGTPTNWPSSLDDEWMTNAMHVSLQVQKAHQREKAGKGRTVLVFDDQKVKADKLNELLFNPPDWSDDYYGRGKKQDRLDQIIDSAYFTKSHHAGLVQVADLFAFVLRRYAELNAYGAKEKQADETRDINELVKAIQPRLMSRGHRFPQKSAPASAKTFNHLAPDCLVALK